MLDYPTLQYVRLGYAPMPPGTAICFMASGLAVLVLGERRDRRLTALGAVLAVGVLLVTAADFLILAEGSYAGLGEMLMRTFDPRRDGSTSPATAICFALTAGCLLLRPVRIRGQRAWYSGLATTGLFVALIPLMGYAFDAVALYEVSLFTAMALHTALGFALLFLAILFVRPTLGWMRIAVGRLGGSVTVRRLLPAVLATPFLFAWVTLQATEMHVFSPNFRLSLSAIASMALLSALLVINGARQNSAEQRREQAFRQLEAARRELERIAAQRKLLLREVYHRVKNNLQVVEALMVMQSRDLRDDRSKEAFFVTRRRVNTLGLIHQQLMQSGDLSRIELREFLDRLAGSLAFAQGAQERAIAVLVGAADIDIDIDLAIPIGLLVNELVTNAFRHAFAGRPGGTIRVSAFRDGDNLVLTIADDGVGGTARASSQPANDSIGERISRALVAQLRGSIRLTDHTGRCVEIVVPLSTEENGGAQLGVLRPRPGPPAGTLREGAP